jgi:hypothetical protein
MFIHWSLSLAAQGAWLLSTIGCIQARRTSNAGDLGLEFRLAQIRPFSDAGRLDRRSDFKPGFYKGPVARCDRLERTRTAEEPSRAHGQAEVAQVGFPDRRPVGLRDSYPQGKR